MQKLYTGYQWIEWIAQQHPKTMDFDLDRIRIIAARLEIQFPQTKIITVAGTNGKGSTCAGLQSIYRAAGYRVGTFTSPYLFSPHEQVNLDGQSITDAELCQAFAKIDTQRKGLTITQFELMTLAALWIFMQQSLDVVILEVGLGGRLDATNIIDADLAIITSIDLDHTQLLGNTREAIGLEKAGILRPQQLAIYGDPNPPATVIAHANALQTKMHYLGTDYDYAASESSWDWRAQDQDYRQLPNNGLAPQNMAAVLMAVHLLQSTLPVSLPALRTGLQQVSLMGRQELLPGQPQWLFDVAHNPAAIQRLAARIHDWRARGVIKGRVMVIFSMLADKAIADCVALLKPLAAGWWVAPVDDPRSATLEQLQQVFQGVTHAMVVPTLDDAYRAAIAVSQPDDCILVCGSFRCVGHLRQRFQSL